MSVTGDPDGPPTKVGVAVVDVLAGLHAAVGILGALHARERGGEGQRIEVDLLTSALSGLVNQASAVIAAGANPGRLGNAHREILHTLLTDALRTRPAAEWAARLGDAGVPSGPLNDIAGGIRMAEDLGLGPVVTAGPAESGVPTVRHPIRWSSGDLDYSKAPPERDADRDRILRWLAADSG